MTRSTVGQEEIRKHLRELGLSGRPVCVHSSLRSFGWVEGGPDAVIDAFLAEACTLLVPSFTYHYNVSPPPDDRPARNGSNYNTPLPATDSQRVYHPNTEEISREDMGAIPAAVVSRPGRSRGLHPLNSFAAVGPFAAELVRGQTAVDVYAPFQRLAELNGAVLMMGVGLDSMTLLHYGEQLAGRNLFVRWAVDASGKVIRVRGGGCSEGFPYLDGVLATVEQRRMAGASLWRVFPVRDLLDHASRAIREDTYITHCRRDECERCRDAVLGGPLVEDS